MKKFVKKYGFDSVNEFHKMMANVDLGSVEKLQAFEVWKEYNGTKKGLSKLKQLK